MCSFIGFTRVNLPNKQTVPIFMLSLQKSTKLVSSVTQEKQIAAPALFLIYRCMKKLSIHEST